MNELSKYLVEQILLEDENPIKKIVVIYVGRFQPFHKGHYGTYSHLVKKFGKDNVFIGTSNKTEKPKSPFNFKEKVKIMNTMFGIPTSKIHQVKNPYKPTEILSKFDEESTAFITVVGEKDSNRLGGKYFTPYKGTADEPYKDRGYVYAAPSSGGGVSGTEVRNGLSVGSDEQKEDFFKNRAYGKFNKSIFKMITDKLNEDIHIPKDVIEEWLITEGSRLGSGQVDDGPNLFFPNYDVFNRVNIKRATKIGYEVVNMIMSKDIEDYYEHPNYPNGPVKAVSFFPAGVIGTQTAANQIDIYSSKAYSDWYKHITRSAALVGYQLIDKLGDKEDKKQSGEEARDVKKVEKEFDASLNENINIPVKVGDTILTGRFKNKKTVVKSIGKDEYGMPTINGKKVVTFRLVNEGFHAIFEDEREDEKYTHIGYGKFKLKGKEKDPNSPTFQKDDSGKYTELEKDGNSTPQKPQGQSLTKGDSGEDYRNQLPDNDPAKKQEPEQDNWEKVDDKNNYYKSVRKYTDKELENETGEYFENEPTMKTAPNAFKDKADMIEKMKNAKPVYLSSEEMENMDNTDMGDILNSDNPKQTAKELADEYGKDISWQYGSMEKNEKVPAPIALRDKNGEYYLLAGNTRAMAFTAAGKKLPIKVIDYDGEFQYNESISESNWPKSKLSTQHDKDFDHHLNYRLSKKFKGNFEVIGFDLYHNGKKLFTIDKRDTYNSVIRKTLRSLKESVNEIAGTAVKCEKCNHSWEIESEDTEKYLCHSCGWDSQKQEYDFDAFDSWQEKMGLNEEVEEARRGGKLRPAALVRRKFALAGKGPEIARARKRTMMRRKSLDKLKKIAYKMAYRQVYDEFAKELYPDIKKSDLSVEQSKVVHRNVLRKKKRVLKRARFRFLPDLRAKEAEKFSRKDEMSKSTLNKIEKYAEKQLSPEDIEFTKHFFDRINDPRNGKEISDAELTGFFKRLSRYKKQFKDFLEKYQQIVVKDKRSDINIPFVKQANQIIAKTVMRKDDFKTSNPVLAFEQLAKGMSLRDIAEKHDVSFEELSKEAKKGVKVEMEHTSDVKQAYDIAKDHLFEDPKYYTKLATIEELAIGYPDQEWMDNHEKKMKKLRKQLDSMNEELIMEGGAYGHMNHPFDTEINLTFGDLKDIVNRALEGNLELTREKTDGQALAISWRDGRLVAARNKGHLKNKGENALDIKGVADKFAGRGELEKAYNFAMNDLSKAIKSLSEKQRDKIFKGGACFMNLEVIYPTSVNVIPYGQALLVFHGTMEYNENGEAIGENQEAARVLAGMIKQVNQNVQSNYTIQGPPVIQLPKNQDLSSKKGKYTSQISKLQKEFGLKDTDGVAEYHQAWWSNWIDKNSPKTLDNKTKMGLVKRFAFFDKSFRLDSSNISDEKVLEWAKKHEKDNHKKISKDNLMKFENIFLGLGAEVLEFTSSVLTVNPDKAVRDIKKRIDKTIKDVKKSGDPKKIEKLKLELQRLNSIGGPDKIVPNEGIVFQYKGNTFKLTGTFASVNQLLGIFF